MAIIPLFVGLVGIILTIMITVAIFEIRTASQKTAARLDDIYRLLSERSRP